MRTTAMLIVVSAALAFGCNKPSDAPDNDGSVEINAPGVDVKVEPGEGVDVSAPGVDVEASREEGGEVEVNE